MWRVQLSSQGPVQELFSPTWANVCRPAHPMTRANCADEHLQVNQGLHGQYRDILTTYWQQTITNLETETHDYKIHQLPLARIKKVMKADPEVKMISAEAPILFAKGCDIFITELTMRAWIHAEENKRRTLQRSDIASALAKSDMFDFLIDIVPREEAAGHAKRTAAQAGPGSGAIPPASGPASNQLLPPPNNVQQQPPSGHQQQHHIAHPEYPIANNPMPHDQDYRPQPGMYTSQVPQDPSNAYGQPQQQIFEGMYGYPPMAPQQVCVRLRKHCQSECTIVSDFEQIGLIAKDYTQAKGS